MRRHLSRYERENRPIAGAVQIRQQRHYRITLALSILTGLAIGLSLRSIREDKAAKEAAAAFPDYGRAQSILEAAQTPYKPDMAKERARYATFEEAMGLRDTKNGPVFQF